MNLLIHRPTDPFVPFKNKAINPDNSPQVLYLLLFAKLILKTTLHNFF